MKMMHCVGLVSILTISLSCVALTLASSPKYPVILVPGFGGSGLWRKGGGSNDFEGVWIDLWTIWDFITGSNKLTDQLTLLFDNSTGKTREKSDQKIQACGFGDPTFLKSLLTGSSLSQKKCDGAHERTLMDSEFDTETFRSTVESALKSKLAEDKDVFPHLHIESKEEFKIAAVSDLKHMILKLLNDLLYFLKIITTLTDYGYVGNKDIRAAQYDFRKAPSELDGYFADLKKLIEDTSANNGNLPVVVIAHSMGNPLMKHFYNHYTEPGWTQKYIKAHVALAPPWAGAVKMLGVITSGENFEIPFLNSTRFRAAARTFPSSIWLTPCVSCNGVWDDHPPIVVTPLKNYSISTEGYRQLFKDLNYEAGYDMWQWIGKDSLDVSTLPNVPELHVLYGTDVDTSHQFVYNKQADFPDVYPSVIKGEGNGDGTVNIRSLEAMKLITVPDGMVVNHTSYSGVDHMGICWDPRVIDYIVKLVTTVKPSVKTEL